MRLLIRRWTTLLVYCGCFFANTRRRASAFPFQPTHHVAFRSKPSSQRQVQSAHSNRIFVSLHASFSSGDNKNGKKKPGPGQRHNVNKNLSAAERERREEESRRKERKQDVVINKTSAKQGAKDYPLDIKATEEAYLKSASRDEQQVYQYTEQGLQALNNLRLQEADDCFEKVFQINYDQYLWQAGIVKFYLGDFVGAAALFKRNAELFEKKFGGQPASEERIWHDACVLKHLNSIKRKKDRKKLEENGGIESIMPSIVDQDNLPDEDDEFMAFAMGENRKVIKLTRDMFTAAVEKDSPKEFLAKAKLASIAGSVRNPNTAQQQQPMVVMDLKSRKLTSLFYLGLYHDVLGEVEDSKKCFKMALQLSPSAGKSSDIVQTLPLLHMTARDWFDDDALFGDDDDLTAAWEDTEARASSDTTTETDTTSSTPPNDTDSAPSNPLSNSKAYSDPAIEDSILTDVNKLTVTELKESLRIRGIQTTGSKQALRDRLFYSLMEDAGFQSGFAP